VPGGEFETGNLTLAVMQCDAFGIEFQPNEVPVALRVDDVEAARSALEEKGVSFPAETVEAPASSRAR